MFNGKNTVHKVYVVGGDGKDSIDNAISSGCDTIITGRGSYNTTIDAQDMGINIVEAGHFFTENPVVFSLMESFGLEKESTIVVSRKIYKEGNARVENFYLLCGLFDADVLFHIRAEGYHNTHCE